MGFSRWLDSNITYIIFLILPQFSPQNLNITLEMRKMDFMLKIELSVKIRVPGFPKVQF